MYYFVHTDLMLYMLVEPCIYENHATSTHTTKLWNFTAIREWQRMNEQA